MKSPPDSPSRLQGASRTTGGFVRGRAHGNVYNFGDSMNVNQQLGRVKGKVHVYTEHGNPDNVDPFMSLRHEVTPSLGTVLKKLGKQYSPVKSQYIITIFIYLFKYLKNFRAKSTCLCV